MPTETIVRVTYWGGWVSAAVALLYRFLVMTAGAGPFAVQVGVLPYHFWQMSFLLFIISIATASAYRAKTG